MLHSNAAANKHQMHKAKSIPYDEGRVLLRKQSPPFPVQLNVKTQTTIVCTDVVRMLDGIFVSRQHRIPG